MSWVKLKLKLALGWFTRASENLELGPMERVTLPFKFLFITSSMLVALFAIGAHFSSGAPLVFVYIWLFLLSMWALLHVKKSTTTWGKFDEIDQREADFAEEVDRRLEAIQKDLKSLKEAKKAAAAAQRQEKKAPKKAKRTKKVQRTHVEEQTTAPSEPTTQENKE